MVMEHDVGREPQQEDIFGDFEYKKKDYLLSTEVYL